MGTIFSLTSVPHDADDTLIVGKVEDICQVGAHICCKLLPDCRGIFPLERSKSKTKRFPTMMGSGGTG